MFSRSLHVTIALVIGIASRAGASSMACSSATGSSSSFTTLPSCSPMFSCQCDAGLGKHGKWQHYGAHGLQYGWIRRGYSLVLWRRFSRALGTTLDAGVGGDAFTIVSDDQLIRADNTALAWNGSAWLPAAFVNSPTRTSLNISMRLLRPLRSRNLATISFGRARAFG